MACSAAIRRGFGLRRWRGLLACYAFGTLWFVKVYGDTKGPITLLAALSKCVFPFIVPDLAKLALALWAGKRLEKI